MVQKLYVHELELREVYVRLVHRVRNQRVRIQLSVLVDEKV